METVLKTNQLTKCYHNDKVVNNVNMTIKAGDVYGFVGPNGAGKTTIIRLISGLIYPTSGSFSLFDVEATSHEIYGVKRQMAAVVESPSLYMNLSAYDNLKMQCLIMGINDLSIITEVITMVGLDYLLDSNKKAGQYSLGMRQRLGIAMALITKPKFLLLDEPMNGLDPEGIVEIRELILKLNREEGITILISSHILGELAKVATCYGIINHGNLIKEISAEELNKTCRKCVEIRTSLNIDLEALLKTTSLTNYQVYEHFAKIFDEISLEDLLSILHQAGITIDSINCRDESIEDYYLNLVGGHHHA